MHNKRATLSVTGKHGPALGAHALPETAAKARASDDEVSELRPSAADEGGANPVPDSEVKFGDASHRSRLEIPLTPARGGRLGAAGSVILPSDN